MKKFMFFTLSLILSASVAQAACEVAVLIADPTTKAETGAALSARLESVLQKVDVKNKAYQVYNPYLYQGNYLYTVTPVFNGFSVAVSVVGTPMVVWGDVYNAGHFRSQTQVVATLAGDFQKAVLPLLSRCSSRRHAK